MKFWNREIIPRFLILFIMLCILHTPQAFSQEEEKMGVANKMTNIVNLLKRIKPPIFKYTYLKNNILRVL